MKNTLLTAGIAAAAGLLAAGCSKQEGETRTDLTENSVERYIPLDLSLSGGQSPVSRTALQDDHSLCWEQGDSIAIFAQGVSASYRKERAGNPGKYLTRRKELINFALSADRPTENRARFQAPEGHADGDYAFFGFHWKINSSYPENTRTFYAYYPHREEKPFANYSDWDNTLPFSLPNRQTQNGKDDTRHLADLDILYASAVLSLPEGAANNDEIAASLHFDFRHLFALLKYQVTNSTGASLRIDRIVLDAGRQAIAGDFAMDTRTGVLTVEHPSSNIVLDLQGGIVLDAGESFTAYMIAAEATLSDATVRVETERGEQEFSANATLTAGNYYTKEIRITAPAPSYRKVTADFEDIVSGGQDKFLADSPFGDNIDGKNTNYAPYTDPATGLVFSLNKGAYQPESYDYHRAGGGFWGSNYHDMTTPGIDNHSSVYFTDAKTGKGGCGGSEYFAVCFESASSGMSLSHAQISFARQDREAVFDHLWVNNTTFAVLDMEGADGALNQTFSYERRSWCSLVITGIRADGSESGRVVFYLADFRTDSAPGIVKEWTKIDLSPLGKIHRLRFSMDSSDKDDFLVEGNPALNNPAYFCIDNVTIRQ